MERIERQDALIDELNSRLNGGVACKESKCLCVHLCTQIFFLLVANEVAGREGEGSHVTIIHDAWDLTIQGSLSPTHPQLCLHPQTWDLTVHIPYPSGILNLFIIKHVWLVSRQFTSYSECFPV